MDLLTPQRMPLTPFQEIKDGLRRLYVDDPRPWLVGFSGGKDSTMLASLVFDAILSIPTKQRKKEVSVVCTDTRVEIPAIVEMIEGKLDRMRRCSQQNGLNISAYLLKPMEDEIAREKGISAETLRRTVAKVEDYSESHRAMGLPDGLLNILKDDLQFGQRPM
jgi:3'-phosphoadenosine 5'-phosphosulfate sulfotransferase (PAPS reductase)/FAD synthetase